MAISGHLYRQKTQFFTSKFILNLLIFLFINSFKVHKLIENIKISLIKVYFIKNAYYFLINFDK